MEREGQKNIVNLLRCAWAGSQKYGALVWSGDIASSFDSMKNQLAAGLNMGLAGIPWWTTGGATCCSGAPNEVWSYGEEVYKICERYMHMREEMRDYTRRLMAEASEKGTPVMRTLFYEVPVTIETMPVFLRGK